LYHGFLNLVSTATDIAGLVVIILAAWFGLGQLEQIKNARISEFLRDFKEFMLNKDHMAARRMIYRNVPHPFAESKAHEQWLSDVKRKHGMYLKIENEIYTIDWLAYVVRQSKVKVDLILDQWFDVIARLTILLHRFIWKEVESRGSLAYVENFCWLARRNVKYIRDKRGYLNPPVTLVREPRKADLPISLDDLDKAVKLLPVNETVGE
jgi:hypothetical protein